jgi:uncharacterized protein YbaP (TraB family)
MKITRGATALVLLSSLWTLNACAQNAARVDVRNTLWRVESGDRSLYLLGSVHALSPDSYPLNPAIEGAFDKSSVLVLEIAIDSATTGSLQMEMIQRGMMSGDRTLHGILPEKTYRMTADRLKEMGMGIGMLEKFKPWVVAVLIAGAGMQEKGYRAELGIDHYFQEKARKSSRPVLGLETAEFQLGLFDGMSLEEQIAFLEQTLTDTKEAPDEIGKIVDAWKRGDTQGLEKFLVKESFSDNPKLLAALVTDRNRRWIPAIEGFLKDSKTHMVVVGALHLVGPEGVVELLRQKGYTVEQL